MPFDSVGVAEDRRSIWGRGEGATNTRPSRFPNEIAKTLSTNLLQVDCQNFLSSGLLQVVSTSCNMSVNDNF